MSPKSPLDESAEPLRVTPQRLADKLRALAMKQQDIAFALRESQCFVEELVDDTLGAAASVLAVKILDLSQRVRVGTVPITDFLDVDAGRGVRPLIDAIERAHVGDDVADVGTAEALAAKPAPIAKAARTRQDEPTEKADAKDAKRPGTRQRAAQDAEGTASAIAPSWERIPLRGMERLDVRYRERLELSGFETVGDLKIFLAVGYDLTRFDGIDSIGASEIERALDETLASPPPAAEVPESKPKRKGPRPRPSGEPLAVRNRLIARSLKAQAEASAVRGEGPS